MLAARDRVRSPADFTAVMRRGRRAGGPRVVVHLLVPGPPAPGTHASPGRSRGGLVVSRAVGDAVVRTTVKRRLRHVLAPRLADLPAGSLVVLRANPAAAGATSDELATDVERGLARCQRERGDRR